MDNTFSLIQIYIKILFTSHENGFLFKIVHSSRFYFPLMAMPDGTKNPFLNIFISVLGTCAEMERENIKFRLNSGRERYIANGGKLGRKVGSVKSDEAKKEQYKKVLKELKNGTSVRKTAKLCDVSVSTVQRLKKVFEL